MERFFNNTKKLIFHRQKDILSSALIISCMIIISRFFGFIRYRTLASYFTTQELDIYFAAFRLPDFVFEMLITGALSAAFIPIYIKYKKNEDDFTQNISSIINLILLTLTIVTVILYLTSGFIIPKITPGFDPQTIKTVVSMSQILLLTQLPLLVMGNILAGIGQANKIFFITAIAPVFYNVGIILGTILFADDFYLYGPIIGVIIGAMLFLIVQLPIIQITHFTFKPFIFKRESIKEFVHLFIPRVTSVMTAQIDITIDLALATLLGSGSLAIFAFSQSLQLLPVSVIGMAFGQASLPYITELFKQEKLFEVRKILIDSVLQLFYVSIPLSFFLIFARTPVVRLVFGGSKFAWEDTNMTAITVSIFAVSIPFHTIFYLLTRTFYASHDTKTPLFINVASIIVNTIISVISIKVLHLPVWSLAMAFSISIILNTVLHLVLLHRKVGGYDINKLLMHTFKIYVIAFITSILGYLFMKSLDTFILDTTRTLHVFMLLTSTFGVYMGVYVFFSWFFGVEEIYILIKLFSKIEAIKKKVIELYSGVQN